MPAWRGRSERIVERKGLSGKCLHPNCVQHRERLVWECRKWSTRRIPSSSLVVVLPSPGRFFRLPPYGKRKTLSQSVDKNPGRPIRVPISRLDAFSHSPNPGDLDFHAQKRLLHRPVDGNGRFSIQSSRQEAGTISLDGRPPVLECRCAAFPAKHCRTVQNVRRTVNGLLQVVVDLLPAVCGRLVLLTFRLALA
jgi:hypothetical protein